MVKYVTSDVSTREDKSIFGICFFNDCGEIEEHFRIENQELKSAEAEYNSLKFAFELIKTKLVNEKYFLFSDSKNAIEKMQKENKHSNLEFIWIPRKYNIVSHFVCSKRYKKEKVKRKPFFNDDIINNLSFEKSRVKYKNVNLKNFSTEYFLKNFDDNYIDMFLYKYNILELKNYFNYNDIRFNTPKEFINLPFEKYLMFFLNNDIKREYISKLIEQFRDK